MTATRFDAIVIGSGAGGATMALRLARHGLKTLIVERGGTLRPVSQNGSPGIYIDDARAHVGETFAGGQTKFYGAALYRLRASDFAERAHEAGISPAWPIAHADLEPYYAEAEKLYKVHGDCAGDRRAAQRSGPYPHPPLPHHPIIARLGQRLQKSGCFTSAIPRALDYGPGRPCVLCADCDAHVCTLNAKMDAETAALRPALATGRAELWTDAECLRVEMSPDGTRATGAWIRHRGERVLVSSGIVVVCAGIEGTPLVLRRSAMARHPAGLGNAGGALGRYLAGHSAGMVFPLVSFSKLPPIHTKTLAIHPSPADAEWPHDLGSIQAAGQIPLWRKTGRLLRPAARMLARHGLTFFFMTEALPTRQSGFTFEGDRITARVHPLHDLKSFYLLRKHAIKAFRRAGYPAIAQKRRPYLWHEVGTARMGTDPAISVLDASCRVHGVEGLYVTDASSLPSAGSVNTALTIMALALRTADLIAGAESVTGTRAAAEFRA